MSKKVVDIFTEPESKDSRAPALPDQTPSRPPSLPKEKTLPQKKRFRKLLIFIIVIAVLLYGVRLLSLKDTILSSAERIQDKFYEAAVALRDLDLDRAQKSLSQAEETINSTYSSVDSEGLFKISFRAIPEIFKNLFSLGKTTFSLAANANYLAENAFNFIVNQEGSNLIAGIKNIKTDLEQVSELGLDLKTKSAALGLGLDSDAVIIDAQIFATNQFLSAFLSWLESPEEQNVLILFQNVSEMRPGGGFVGSYSVATLNQASLTELDVRDIYDPDGQLKTRVIPPKPLQSITTDWGARDANWFFDFPLSAKKIISLLEKSEIYKEQDVEFSAVLAINTKVISDILTVTGPISIPEYNRIITNENVLDELQEEVRSGEDRELGEPKRIIKVLTPILFDRLGSLDSGGKRELFKVLAHHVRKKNITVYFEDLTIQSYLGNVGATGAVTNLPEDFSGDYLAVVNANVGGGKTDAVTNQSIKLSSVIDLGGDIHNLLTVERTHNGEDRSEWWYRAENKNYIQILTPPGSKLTSLTGDAKLLIKPLINYSISGYKTDPDLRAFESSDTVFGKTVFEAWLVTGVGNTSRLEVHYKNPGSLDLKLDRIPYTFIFDRQSGARGGIEVTIKAPAGFHWEETDERMFSYADPDPDAQVVINLNLVPDTF